MLSILIDLILGALCTLGVIRTVNEADWLAAFLFSAAMGNYIKMGYDMIKYYKQRGW